MRSPWEVVLGDASLRLRPELRTDFTAIPAAAGEGVGVRTRAAGGAVLAGRRIHLPRSLRAHLRRRGYGAAMSDRNYDPYARLDPVPSFTLTSDDVTDGQPLPAAMFGADSGGQDRSPQLTWTDVPEGTKSFAVTMYDPDAPTGSGFWHWAVADVPVSVTSLEAGADAPAGSVVLRNEMGERSFIGAAPPPGTGVHRYFVVVHAVDVPSLGISPDVTPAVLGFNLHFHTLGRAVLVGTGEAGGAS